MFLKKHPIPVFYIVTLLISWGGVFIASKGHISAEYSNTSFLLLYFITVAGPSLTALLLTGIYFGKKGYREFFSQLIKARVNFKWYAAAVFIAPLSVFATLFALSTVWPVFTPGIFSAGENPIAVAFGLNGNDKITLVLFVTVLGLFNGFVEELGWTGFVTAHAGVKQNYISQGLRLGMMWGLWHLVSNYIGSAKSTGSVPLLLYLAVMLFTFLPPFRILMVWVYEKTGSLFIGMLMHASLDIFWMLSMPVSITGAERMIWYIAWAAVLWIAVGVVKQARLLSSTRVILKKV